MHVNLVNIYIHLSAISVCSYDYRLKHLAEEIITITLPGWLPAGGYYFIAYHVVSLWVCGSVRPSLRMVCPIYFTSTPKCSNSGGRYHRYATCFASHCSNNVAKWYCFQ